MKRLVQLLCNAYEHRPDSTKPERASWDVKQIEPVKSQLEKFANTFLSMEDLVKIKETLRIQTEELKESLDNVNIMMEMMQKLIPGLKKENVHNVNEIMIKEHISKVEELFNKFAGMLTILELAEETGMIKKSDAT